MTKTIFFDRKILRKTSPKNTTRNSKKIPQRNEKNNPIVRENRPTGNTGYQRYEKCLE